MVLIAGIFLILHGLVHLLYFAQSARYFELKPGMTWPDNAWLFSPFFGQKAVRVLASNLCILAGLGFIITGITIFERHANWYFLAIGSSLFSTFIYLAFWNGKLERMNSQGAIAVLINIAIAMSILIFRWPKFDF